MIKWKQHPEYTAFLMEYIPGHTESEIREAFNERFGIILSEGHICNFKNKHKIKSGTKGGCFPKGHVPANKGKKMSPEQYEKAAPTMFKKGQAPVNYRPVGSERISVDGYIEIKVEDPNKWRLKHRVAYEQYHNVTLTANDSIIFLDGDHLNLEKDNLYRMTRAELVRYNQDKLYCSDREISRVAANIAKLKDKKGRAKNDRSSERNDKGA